MHVPLVSVVLPVRNAVGTLERAVRSIQAQTCADWELVAIDDSSTDGTLERLRALAAGDPRIRLAATPGNGIVAALNAGVGAARGQFIARMDADDESLPERIAQQVAYLRAAHEVGLVGCLVEYGGNRLENAGYALHVDWVNSLLTPEEIAVNRFVESPFAHPSVMFRRELVDRFGGYRAGEFPEDYELWLRWMDHGVAMAKIPGVLVRWNDWVTRLSRTDPRYAAEAFFRMKAEWIARELRRVVAGRSVYIWGAGRPTRKRAAHLEPHGVRIAGYIDVDAKKITPAIGGRGPRVIPPAELPPPGRIFVLSYVASRGARDAVRDELQRRRYRAGSDFLLCA